MSLPAKDNSPIILDCTLRDGGYYNNWDFSTSLVSLYLEAMDSSGVDVVEIGFRFLPKKGHFVGAFGYSTDEFLRELPLPKKCMLGVMINAKEYIQHPEGGKNAILQNFSQRSESPVGFVRLACHFTEVKAAKELVQTLVDLGYRTGLNVMQAGSKTVDELQQAAQEVNSWDLIDVLYFADSLGNMSSRDVIRTLEAFRSGWSKAIGIHAHNNMSQALSNSLAAFQKGATWLDSTVLGMGRGAGNTCTEYLLQELKEELGEFDPESLFPLVLDAFEKLREEYKWGPNLIYYLSAKYKVHPTYAQEMLKFDHYNANQIISALKYLKDNKGSNFSNDQFNKALFSHTESHEGQWSAKDWAKDREILILGSGPSVNDHQVGLQQYIKNHKPLVLSLNINEHIDPEFVSAYVCCYKTRLILDADLYKSIQQPVIMPLGMVPESLRAQFENLQIFDYGMEIDKNRFESSETSCVVPNDLAIAYALAVCKTAGAKRVLLAGFDGYEASDPKQDEMIGLLQLCKRNMESIPLVAVTPSSYPIEQSSIYSSQV